MNESPVTYRETRLVDTPLLLDFIQPFVEQQQLLPRSEQQMRALTRHGFVAQCEGEIVGFAAIEVYSRKMAEVQCLAVSSSMQGRGVGRQLVAFCIERASELGVTELMAISASEGFLVGCGFHYSLPNQKKALFIQPFAGATDQPATTTASSLWHDHVDTMRWPPRDAQLIETVEAHAAGEPLRVLLRGAPLVAGSTMLEKHHYAEEHLDALRRALMWEPRGHADMCGALLTAPTTPDGDLGVLFLQNDGFSTMCGHAIIALATVLWESGMTNQRQLEFDTPAGRVSASIEGETQRATRVSFLNVPAFVDRLDFEIAVPGWGDVCVDIAYGGTYYAFCDVRSIGDLPLTTANAPDIVRYGQLVKNAILQSSDFRLQHPDAEELGFLDGVIFTSPAVGDAHSRHACVFANGELDRSPAGAGVSARAALLHARGQLPLGERIHIEGVCGESFDVEAVQALKNDRVRTRVGGRGFLIGRCQWVRRDDDPMSDGFYLP